MSEDDAEQLSEVSVSPAMEKLVEGAALADPVDLFALGGRTMRGGAIAVAVLGLGEIILAIAMQDLLIGAHAAAALILGAALWRYSTTDHPPMVTMILLSVATVVSAGLLLDSRFLYPFALVFAILLVSVPVLTDERGARIFFLSVWVLSAGVFWLWLEDVWAALWLGPVFTAVAWTLSSFIAESHAILRRSHYANRRMLEVVDGAPSPMLLEDFTRLRRTLAAMEARGIDLVDYLDQDERRIPELLSRIEVTYANPASGAFRGTHADDILGAFDPGVINDENRDAFKQQIHAISRGDTYHSATYPEFLTGTKRWVEVMWIVPGGARADYSTVVVVAHDVTEGEAERAALTEATETKDQFVASVAHELRTPLTGLYGLSEILDSEWETTNEEDKKAMIGMIRDQSAHMANIVEDLLVAAKADFDALMVRSEPLDISQLVSSAVANLPVSARLNIEPDVRAMADADRVNQIVRNLLSNAARYGGPNVSVEVQSHKETCSIAVIDDGSGVSAADAETMFEAYRSVHTGTTMSVGLGLWVARHLARLMSGDLVYFRQENQTVFSLLLPSVGD